MSKFETFIETINKYADGYQQLEELQKTCDFIPTVGDQKTGIIGEAFVFEYLSREGHPGLEFGHAAQKAWDIKYPFELAPNDGIVYVQVKTVSEFSKTKRISPIHFAPDRRELYLVHLDKRFIPINVWKPMGYDQAKLKTKNGEKIVIGTRMPKDEQDAASGFTGIENITERFKKMFPEIY